MPKRFTARAREREAEFRAWCAQRKAQQAKTRAEAAQLAAKRRMTYDTRAFPDLSVRVWLMGRRRDLARLVERDDRGRLDWIGELRELVLERVRFDVYAEWSDPRDSWTNS